jgi:hypothetical protein
MDGVDEMDLGAVDADRLFTINRDFGFSTWDFGLGTRDFFFPTFHQSTYWQS